MTKMTDNLRDLRVGDYEKILRISQEAATLPEGDDVAALPYQARIIAVLAGMDEREVMNLPLAEYSALAAASDFLRGADGHADKTAASYQVGAFTLEPVKDVRALTTAQYIDFQTFTAAEGVHLAEVLSTMLVPRGCKYADGYDPLEVQRAIREDMSAAEALDLLAFFTLSFEVSIGNILTSLRVALKRVKGETRTEIKERMTRLEAVLQTVGRGLPS